MPQKTMEETTMNRLLILTLLPAALGAQAACLPDAPELGDIGPDSVRVCSMLEQRFPGTLLTVDDRSIHSSTTVTVSASVNGNPVRLDYRLIGFEWVLDELGGPIAGTDIP
jgi:hypothetical protein